LAKIFLPKIFALKSFGQNFSAKNFRPKKFRPEFLLQLFLSKLDNPTNFGQTLYNAYHQIVTIKISKNRNYLEEFSSLVVIFEKKIAKRNYLVVGTVITFIILDENRVHGSTKFSYILYPTVALKLSASCIILSRVWFIIINKIIATILSNSSMEQPVNYACR